MSSDDSPDRPLFGDQTRPRDKVVNLAVGITTTLIVIETVVLACAHRTKVINLFLAAVLVAISFSHITLIYWYRQGDLDPKFRKMILYNSLVIIFLSISINIVCFYPNLIEK